MNESSSKFVDNIAIEKIKSEKLLRVSHSPKNSHFIYDELSLLSINSKKVDSSKLKYSKSTNGFDLIKIPSIYKTLPYKENNTIYLYNSPCEDSVGNILFVHGLYDEHLLNYTFLIKMLNKLKFNVFMMTLPYHHKRKPKNSLFSGEYFLSADVYRTKKAFIQSVYDIEASVQFVNYTDKKPLMLVGFSMGGCVSLKYYTIKNKANSVFLINPVAGLSRLIWDNPMLGSIRNDLRKHGWDEKSTEVVFEEVDVLNNISPDVDFRPVALAYSIYDQLIEEKKYKSFVQKTDIENINIYHAGHLNILRVPKLSRDIYDFFLEVN
ncbi:alpha/beta fold hydrolase [Herbivorax sp. ANBcel31]|uniref:alpha/beta hydrolase n=1 Tax=Herbivorax sp. ANBcel31 TaxID=3069754 RepID=UPI0027B6F84D|nr:alpha/beta fold hydrolase [Herbivorax sp. ANBcel31]MDQ2086119.1 alpha/beta fold hydrolase [Herbivorax sp. ANBcel31]